MTLGLGMIEISCCFKLWALTSLGAKTCLRIYLPQEGHALGGGGWVKRKTAESHVWSRGKKK